MDWIEAFIDATEGIPSPPLFRRWGAISAVSATMERKAWIESLGTRLYPNMYNIVIGGPGSGKTFVTSLVRDLLEHHKRNAVEDFYICLLYTSPSPRDRQKSRMPSSA